MPHFKESLHGGAGGMGGDSHPAQEPQAREDLGIEPFNELPTTTYRFFYAHDDLQVSSTLDFQKLMERARVNESHTGPMALGNIVLEDDQAHWLVETNMGIKALEKVLQKYTKEANWIWGGLMNLKGEPIAPSSEFAPKVTYWYNQNGRLNLSKKPLEDAEGKVEVYGKTAYIVGLPSWRSQIALEEWARDFGYKLAEYPGGGSMTDSTMEKNHPPLGEDLEEKNIYSPNMNELQERTKNKDEKPSGPFSCPGCGTLFEDWDQYLTHRTYELNQDGPQSSDEDGGFPEIEEATYREMAQPYEGSYRRGAKQPKDLFDDPVPFIFDIDKDAIFVGPPGTKHNEIGMEPKLTPGGLVQGTYEKGGKVVIESQTDTPFAIRHLLNLWKYQHPEFEVTSVHLLNRDGKIQKVASNPVSQITTLARSDPAANAAWKALRAAGGKTYVVGGAVRDVLLGKAPKDIDLLVSGLPPEEVNNALSNLPGRVDLTGKDFGVYRYRVGGSEVEIALPRTEKSTGSRRVDFDVSVDHNLPIESDLLRRDFTANAIAVDLDTGSLVDPYNGAGDIFSGKLKTVHPDSFKEDPTRLIRAVVAHGKHGLVPDDETLHQMVQHAHSLNGESPERIQAELDKLFASNNPAGAITLMQQTGMLKHIFPEVDHGWDFDQKNPHHNHTLGTHLLQVLDGVTSQTKDPDLRLAALLHDIGKPHSQWIDDQGIGHYYKNEHGEGDDHETVGAQMALDRMKALRYPNDRVNRVRDLIQHHMFPSFSSPKGARKFLQRVGDHADDLLTLRHADMYGKGTNEYQDTKTPVDEMRGHVQQVRDAREPTGLKDLAVNGNDLLGLGLQPGPILGQILQELSNLVVESPELNEKHTLLNYVREQFINAAG